MFLDSTTKTLEIILGSAKTTNDMPVTIDYVDITANTLTPGESDTVSNGLTAVTILASPAAGVQRKVNGLFVYNADTATKLVTIRLNNNSVLRPFVVANLSSGDTLGYTDTGGCYVTDSNGSRKVVASGSPNYLNKSAGVVTVGVSNCDYTTIQGALTANPTAGLLVLVYPGTYTDTINFTANGQCVVGMGTARQQNIQQVSANILNIGAFSNCRASNLTLTITAATSAVACVTGTTGTAEIVECNLNCTNSTVTAASQPALVNITGAGSVAIESGEYTYTNTVSDGTGVTAIKAAFVSGTGASITVNFPDNITITGSGQSLGTTLAFSSTSGNFIINRSFVSITDTGATVVAGYYYAGSGTTNEFGYNHITVNGGGANSVIGVYLNGTATLTSHFNHFFCSGGLTNYSFNIAAGNTINSYGDALNAASGYTGAGTIKVASSPSAGDWKITGDFQQSQTPTATAAGTTQGTGTAVTTRTTIFTTVASGTGGTLTAVTSAGVRRTVDNDGANILLLYPPSGGAFFGYAVNAPISIPPGGMVELESTSAINFDILLGPDVALNSVQVNQVNGAQISGFRNKIINGDYQISQINASNSVTVTAGAALAYTIDQFYAYCTGANVAAQRVAGINQSRYRYQFTGAASVTGIGIGQRMSSADTYDLNGKSAIFGINISNSLLTSVTWTLYYANTTDTFGTLASPTRTQIATGTFTVTGTESRYFTPVISIPAAAITGLEIVLTVGAQTSGTWIVGDWQLEQISAGMTTGTSFERVPESLQFSRCAWYCEIRNISSGWLLCCGHAASATQAYGAFTFLPKRNIPVITVLSGTLSASIANGTSAGGSCAFTGITANSANANVTGAAGMVAGNASDIFANGGACVLEISARL